MTRQKIVYLDDSEVSLEAVKEGLAAFEIDVTAHRNALTVYAALAAAKPTLLLLDAQMPTLDGKTICTLVKRHMPTLPIVLFSSLPSNELQKMVAECGADGFITKTDKWSRLAADLRRIILRNSAKL